MFKKILVANRGEIALKIIKVCRSLGIITVAVYSEEDRSSLHTLYADESICIGSGVAKDSYLVMENIISAAILTKADAIHPGIGFLAENFRFAEICEKCNIIFIGPPSSVIKKAGNKVIARNLIKDAGIPVVPGNNSGVVNLQDAVSIAKMIGFPVLIKAVDGGGGKGIRVSYNENEFNNCFRIAQFEATRAFGNNAMYIEKKIKRGRHIEFQILADKSGNIVHLGDRDCTMQKKHQKIIEETPSSTISDKLREELGETSKKIAKVFKYENIGTVEFLVDEEGNYFFIEMNTRLQVEYGITEMVTDINIIKEQILIAMGGIIDTKQEDIKAKGHAIECRINISDSYTTTNTKIKEIGIVQFPKENEIRVDTAIYTGMKISLLYDALIMKVMVRGKNREIAIRDMNKILKKIILEGISTNLEEQCKLINSSLFANNIYTIDTDVEQVIRILPLEME